MAVDTTFDWGLGRRKSSVARVRIKPGTGTFQINKKDLLEYFPRPDHQRECRGPLVDTELMGKFDIYVNVNGGGISGQAGAVRLGLARALVKVDGEMLADLKAGGHVTRDPRMKERKKYGLRGARRAFQFSKR
ncbi:MAG: small subunit ribosomal protein S9 [Planctomycetota bacterium]|jgi:small subunit ribosomal protein S9